MSRLFRRTSFTTRLLALAALVMALLVLIDYVALLQLPSRVARDTVEIALRDNVQGLNANIRDQRAQLRDETERFVDRGDVARAIVVRDEGTLRRLLAGEDDLQNVKVSFLPPDDVANSDIGVVTVQRSLVDSRGRLHPVAIYRDVDDSLLETAASARSEVHFALEVDGHLVARSAGFPDSISAKDLNAPVDVDTARLKAINVDGEDVHAYSRRLTTATAFQLHAISTPRLEEQALREIRGDVRTAIAGMTAATVAAFLFLVFFTSRTVRRFADRVRLLADGDYGTTLPVRGEDAFAELAGSVNRLSHQLEAQLGQLEQTANAFSRTLETLEEGICVWDEDGDLQYWNHGSEQLTGISRERADRTDPVVALLHAERAPGTRRINLPVRRAGGGLVVDLVVTAMPGGGILQTFRDTTLVDMLQQTQRNFMATAAHELRTPITTILGFADTLSNPELQLTERQRDEFLDIISEQSHHLQELAEAFFTSYQLANERVEVSITATMVDGAIREALERLRAASPERSDAVDAVTVDVPERCAALADRRALVGVIAALVDNALKYGAPPLSVKAQVDGGMVAVLVRDAGQGIDHYHQARVFDPFFRVDVDMRQGVGGAGLGLFTARKLIEAMHGAIRVRSDIGDGTTFIVELPIAPVDAAAPEGDQPATARTPRDRSLRLADDRFAS
jgi:two-component system phosphate regulon sensor histidine kinase PhoR